jgi:hypothetical protein
VASQSRASEFWRDNRSRNCTIENWLELEFGLSTLTTAGHTELSGETIVFTNLNGPECGDSWRAEFALEWMFWPTKNVGWFIEPTWSVNP